MNTTSTEEATTSSKVATYRTETARLEQVISRAEAQLVKVREQFTEELRAAGWQEFDFFSDYYGSHSELGEGTEERKFFFTPAVDLTLWQGVCFSHGHHGASDNNNKFWHWLGQLADNSYEEV